MYNLRLYGFWSDIRKFFYKPGWLMSCEVMSSGWTGFSWSSPLANSSSFFLRIRHQRHPIREYKYLSAKAIEFPILARNTIITGKPTVMYAMNCNFPFVVVGTICPYPKIFYLFDGIMIKNTNIEIFRIAHLYAHIYCYQWVSEMTL